MKKEVFENFLNNAKIEKNKWISLPEVESIMLKGGIGIYPNWIHLRFYITDSKIFIRHGSSTTYGARLSSRLRYSYNYTEVTFEPSSIVLSSRYCTNFRLPRAGDFLVSSDSPNHVLSTSMIIKVESFANAFTIKVSNPIKDTPTSILSFYDPEEYDKDNCIHGTVEEVIYVKFSPNETKKKSFGKYHEVIKVKNITEINLRLVVGNKTYKVI